MKAIIVDDERKGRDYLQHLIQNYCADVAVVAQAANITTGVEVIKTHSPDLVFLDIEMPNGNGFDLLNQFETINFQIIFTTAFDHYALKAIKHHALDYLLKPVDIDELKKAVEQAKKQSQLTPSENRYTKLAIERKSHFAGKLALPVKDGTAFVSIPDIVRIESDGSYSTVYTSDGCKYVVSKNLGEYEDLLAVNNFFRIHKCHLVNTKKVKKYLRQDGYFVEMDDGSVVEISRRKKDEFLKMMAD